MIFTTDSCCFIPWPNVRNILAHIPTFASSSQTIATFERNISQQFWVQYCVRLATLLRRVATCWVLVCMPGHAQHCTANPDQTITTSCNIHNCCMKNLTIFKFEPTTPNMSQYVATHHNRMAKREQHAATNNDGICCIERLLSFGRGFKFCTL